MVCVRPEDVALKKMTLVALNIHSADELIALY